MKVGNHTAEGAGTNKKVAKRNAAENMLEILGFKVPQAQPAKPALKSEEKVTAGTLPGGLAPCMGKPGARLHLPCSKQPDRWASSIEISVCRRESPVQFFLSWSRLFC